VINGAVKDANDDHGSVKVHFVDTNAKWENGGHHWCSSEDVHEPKEDRDDTWFFLSGWKDIGTDSAVANTVSYLSLRDISKT